MYQCAWCKNDTEVYEWSKDKEPLCSECAYKYQFGLVAKMIDGKVSDLSKEQRRGISEERNKIERVWECIHLVSKEVLVGRLKTVSNLVGLALFLLWVLSLLWLGRVSLPDWFIFHGLIGAGLFFIAGLVIPTTLGFLMFLLLQRIIWCIKFWQLKRRMQSYGYKVNLFLL